MPPKPDRYALFAAELLKKLAAFDAALLDEPAQDIAEQEAARVKLVAGSLRQEFESPRR